MTTAWLDSLAAATHLGIKPRRLHALIKAGKLPQPSYYLGPRSPRWDQDKIDSLMAGRRVEEDADAAAARVVNAIKAEGEKSARRRGRP